MSLRPLVTALLGGALFLATATVRAADLNLGTAVIIAPADLSGPEAKAVTMLVEEAQKRTQIRWEVTQTWPGDNTPVIAVGPVASLKHFAGPFAARLTELPAFREKEGYRIRVEKDGRPAPAVFVLGNDARGVLFGIGRLLRELHMTRGKITLDDTLDLATAPKFPLRGHQLGYRPKTNSYDGWTPALWEQYYRDLIVFGTNAVELIPPRSDDAADSPHFPLPPMEMMTTMSRLARDYGLDLWIWYPALDFNYGDPKTVESALKEWGEVFRRLPRIDAIFVPGGDPGATQPKLLLALLAKQTENLHRYHPQAQMWVSAQGFSQQGIEEFAAILRTEQPAWLSGVVFGPQIRMSLPELRKALPERYPIRRYPDITHSIQCQYPVPDWDVAHALTSSRECINPRPTGEATIFQTYKDYAIGFITYSEGCNDDVNKIIWSSLGWDPSAKVIDILRAYSRYFIGPHYEEGFAQGLLALERNWKGPLLTNEGVFTTLRQFQDLEKRASPRDRLNWRFQQALYRAYYDAYQRSRLIYETGLEERAMEKLHAAGQLGSMAAMQQAEGILERAVTERVASDWRARIFELAEALFQSIRMQLSVERYQAISVSRGATLDTVDVPLNNRLWLKERFAALRRLTEEAERLDGLRTIVGWTDPGPGGFYDELGNPTRNAHLVRGPGFEKDPAFLQSALIGFAYAPGRRISWCRHAESLNDAPLRMHYEDLDSKARYKVRVVYAGDSFRARVRLLAGEGIEVHPYLVKQANPVPLEFDLPAEATRTGQLDLTWNREPGSGGNGRACQVAEVWLIRK